MDRSNSLLYLPPAVQCLLGRWALTRVWVNHLPDERAEEVKVCEFLRDNQQDLAA